MTDRPAHYLEFARAYAEAARRLLATGIDDETRAPFYALAAHGIELALKAILTRSGWSEERLMMTGHSIASCYAAACRYTPDDPALIGEPVAGVIDGLDFAHAAQCFRYPQLIETRGLPGPALALECLHQILSAAAR